MPLLLEDKDKVNVSENENLGKAAALPALPLITPLVIEGQNLLTPD